MACCDDDISTKPDVQLVRNAEANIKQALNDLALTALNIFNDAVDVFVPIKSIATASGLNPQVSGNGGRAIAGAAAIMSIVPGGGEGAHIGIQEGREALTALMSGDFRVMAGKGVRRAYDGAGTLAGNAADWQYRASAAVHEANGFKWQAHWAYNTATGEVARAKLVALP